VARARDFLNRLIVGTFPRVKDFRGIDTKHIDAAGNLNVGVRESLAFPEINPEKSPVNFGMQITFVVRGAKSRESAIDFYRQLGVPLKVNK
jgi:large subunit ribosomal protein L5